MHMSLQLLALFSVEAGPTVKITEVRGGWQTTTLRE
jgi:hypothetical protein